MKELIEEKKGLFIAVAMRIDLTNQDYEILKNILDTYSKKNK